MSKIKDIIVTADLDAAMKISMYVQVLKYRIEHQYVTGFMKTDHNVTRTVIQIMP